MAIDILNLVMQHKHLLPLETLRELEKMTDLQIG